ncbi:uncharacterized protein RSE6_04884 [Rhynchosporium secalis]|uniref:Uncharacterized protein n=1 Tax=Rhynchosporium secalis TaxID=38038 RepID=A0A1E1M6F6_RHYSE|nr:uncharacterized protein RSE6_04884 [Rhynchosporium secalis]
MSFTLTSECNSILQASKENYFSTFQTIMCGSFILYVSIHLLHIFALMVVIKHASHAREDILASLMNAEPEDKKDEIKRLCKKYGVQLLRQKRTGLESRGWVRRWGRDAEKMGYDEKTRYDHESTEGAIGV